MIAALFTLIPFCPSNPLSLLNNICHKTLLLSTPYRPLESASQLKDYLETMYSIAAQYDRPPMYPVTIVCNGIDGGLQGTDILGRIFSGIVASRGNKPCYDMGQSSFPSETEEGWNWQVMHSYMISICFFSIAIIEKQ